MPASVLVVRADGFTVRSCLHLHTPSDLRKRDWAMFAATTLSAICPCPRAPGRRRARTATDSVRATCLTCADGTTPPDVAGTTQNHRDDTPTTRRHRAMYS